MSHMMKCGFCGSTFQRHLKKEGARWCCYQHRKDKSLCVMEVVAESEVYQTFLLMYNKLLDNKNLILRVMLAQLIELQSKTTFARPEIVDLRQHRTIAEASAVESPIRQETIGFPAHFFARAHNFKPPGRACQPEADSPMRT